MKRYNRGYALVLAIMIIAAITLLVTSMVSRVIVFGRLTNALVDRDQASMLALSGIQIAIGQLSQKPAEQKKEQETIAAGTLKKVGPLINRWQEFKFSEEADGVEGICHIYIASEQGKININQLYDFDQKKFIKSEQLDGLKVLQIVSEKIPRVKTQFAEGVSEVLKKRSQPLQDLTELTVDKQFKKLASSLFPSPEQEITLFDLFTIETQSVQVQPWVISKSLNTVLGLKNHDKSAQEVFDTLVEQSKSVADNIPLAPINKWSNFL